MTAIKELLVQFESPIPQEQLHFLDVLSQTSSGRWLVNLPPILRPYQTELETLLDKVFLGCPHSLDNFELAQQLAINWCSSKCRKVGYCKQTTVNA